MVSRGEIGWAKLDFDKSVLLKIMKIFLFTIYVSYAPHENTKMSPIFKDISSDASNTHST